MEELRQCPCTCQPMRPEPSDSSPELLCAFRQEQGNAKSLCSHASACCFCQPQFSHSKMYGRGMSSGSNPTPREYDLHSGHRSGAPLSFRMTAVPMKAISKSAWDLANWLTHANGATRPDAEIVLEGHRVTRYRRAHRMAPNCRRIRQQTRKDSR